MKRRRDDTFGRNVLDIYAFARGERGKTKQECMYLDVAKEVMREV